MSRSYLMEFKLRDLQPDRRNQVKAAVEEEWNLDWYTLEPDLLEGGGQSSLVGGETEENFAQRVAGCVWEANGKVCPVTVIATCLEDLPHQQYDFGEDAYEQEWDAECKEE